MDYTIFRLQQSINAERRYYTEIPQDDLIVIYNYGKELAEHDADIAALSKYYPEVKKALADGSSAAVNIGLQDLNKLCPRQRVRIDSYNRLVKILKTKNIELTITSRKTH